MADRLGYGYTKREGPEMLKNQAVETELLSWASPLNDIKIAVVRINAGTPVIQLRETRSTPGTAPTPEAFPDSNAGFIAACAIARLRAQIIKREQGA